VVDNFKQSLAYLTASHEQSQDITSTAIINRSNPGREIYLPSRAEALAYARSDVPHDALYHILFTTYGPFSCLDNISLVEFSLTHFLSNNG